MAIAIIIRVRPPVVKRLRKLEVVLEDVRLPLKPEINVSGRSRVAGIVGSMSEASGFWLLAIGFGLYPLALVLRLHRGVLLIFMKFRCFEAVAGASFALEWCYGVPGEQIFRKGK